MHCKISNIFKLSVLLNLTIWIPTQAQVISGPDKIIIHQSGTFRHSLGPEGAGWNYVWYAVDGEILNQSWDSIEVKYNNEGWYWIELYMASNGIEAFEADVMVTVVTPTVEYHYDDAGNRTSRKIEYYCHGQKKNSKTRNEIIKELDETQISMVYPNPTDNEIFLKVEDEVLASAKKGYVLYDALGKAVLNGKINSGLENIKVDHLPNGTYYLILTWGNQRKEWKIIKY